MQKIKTVSNDQFDLLLNKLSEAGHDELRKELALTLSKSQPSLPRLVSYPGARPEDENRVITPTSIQEAERFFQLH